MEDSQQQLLELLDRSGAKLHALLTRITLREDIAEELMQDLFIKLSRIGRSYAIDNWDAYARRAAISLAFDWRRRQKRVTTGLDGLPEPVSEQTSPLSTLEHDEQIQEVLGALGQINGSARQAFVMRYLDQDSYDCIATHLGMTPQQIRALCSRVMKFLRTQLGRNGSPSGNGKGMGNAGN